MKTKTTKATTNGKIKRWTIDDETGFDVELRGKYSGIYIEATKDLSDDKIFIGVGTRREFNKEEKTGAYVSLAKLRKVLDELQEKLNK